MPNCKKGDLAYMPRPNHPSLIGKIWELQEIASTTPELIWTVAPFIVEGRTFIGVGDSLLRPFTGLDPDSPSEKRFLDELNRAGAPVPA